MVETLSFPPSMGRLLNLLAEASCNLAEDYLRPHGLSLAQWVVLSALWRRDGLSVSELAEYSGKKTAALSRLLDRMEKKELVLRVAVDGDKRSVKICLTEEGKRHSHLVDMYQQVNDTMLAGFTAEEQQQLQPLLERMLKNARNGARMPAKERVL